MNIIVEVSEPAKNVSNTSGTEVDWLPVVLTPCAIWVMIWLITEASVPCPARAVDKFSGVIRFCRSLVLPENWQPANAKSAVRQNQTIKINSTCRLRVIIDTQITRAARYMGRRADLRPYHID